MSDIDDHWSERLKMNAFIIMVIMVKETLTKLL